MTFIIIFLVIMFIAVVINAIKEDEIKSNDRVQLLKIYEDKLKNRLTALYFFGGILALGILLYCFGDLHKEVKVSTWLFGDYTRSAWTATHYWAFFCTLTGAMGGIVSAIKANNANYYAKKYRTMNDREYNKVKEDLIKADEINNVNNINLFETPPPCPCCGSEDTRTSDDYRAKAGAKIAGSLLLGAVIGNYTNFSMIQTYQMKRAYKQSIHIEKEYYCKHCGHVWKGVPITQPKQIQNASVVAPKPAQLVHSTIDTAPEQLSPRNEDQGLMELFEAGVLTQEEFNQEMKRIHAGGSIIEETPPKPKTLKEKVQDLRDLKEVGVLTQEEFDSEMNKLLLS